MYPHCGNPKNNSNHDGNPETPMANPEHEERKRTEAEATYFGSHHANHQRQKPRKAEESYMTDRQRRRGSRQRPDHSLCLFAHFTDLSFGRPKSVSRYCTTISPVTLLHRLDDFPRYRLCKRRRDRVANLPMPTPFSPMHVHPCSAKPPRRPPRMHEKERMSRSCTQEKPSYRQTRIH